MRWILYAIGAIALFAAFLFIPFFLKDPPRGGVVGPKLADLKYEEISFQNGDLTLSALLFLPEGGGPFPGAALIHGSGPSRRDNAWYLTFAQHLQENGIAVLLPDKRGSESSGGDWRGASFEVLATDTVAAYIRLAETPEVDAGRVGLIGLSQGGWIAPVAAADIDPAFVVSIAGAGVTTEEQLWFEEVNNIVEMGTFRFVARLIARITVPRIQASPIWRPTAGFDPMPYWTGIDAPVFAAFGGGDTNVPVEESVWRFRGLPGSVRIEVYPDGGHGITDRATGRVQQPFLDDLAAFVRNTTAQP